MFPQWFIIKLWQKAHKTTHSADKGVLIYRDSCILPKQGLLTGNFLFLQGICTHTQTQSCTATQTLLLRRIYPAVDLWTLGEQGDYNRCNCKARGNLNHWFACDITTPVSIYCLLYNKHQPHEQHHSCLNSDIQNSGLILTWLARFLLESV